MGTALTTTRRARAGDVTVPDVDLDVAIVGAGLGPCLLAAALARQGLRVGLAAVPDGPARTPGLSTVPYTAELLLAIAARFDLPEVGDLALLDDVPPALRAASGAKAHLGFLHHREGRSQDPEETVQFRVPDEHAEWHPDREALDAWALRVARSTGVVVLPPAEPGARPGRTVLADGAELRATALVDATEPRGRSGSADAGWRTVGATFRGVRPFGHAVRRRLPDGTLPWSDGTLTHTFPGGWIQLTPLGGDRCGVSLSVDMGRWSTASPAPSALLARVLAALPDVAPQLAGAESVGPWSDTAADRGDPVVPAAPGVLRLAAVGDEPLLARELTIVLTDVLRLGGRLPAALASGADGALEVLRTDRAAFAAHQDRLVAAARAATASFPLWNAYLRVWLLSSIVEALALKRTRLDAAASGDWTAADGVAGAYPFPVPDGLMDLVEDALVAIEEAHAGRLAHRDAAARIFTRLRRDPIVPPLYAFGDPSARTYRFGLLRRLRMLAWVTTSAPRDFRRLLTTENVTGDAADGPSV